MRRAHKIYCLFIFILLFAFNAEAVIVTKEAKFDKPSQDLQIQKIIEAMQGRISFLDTSETVLDGRASQNLDIQYQVFTSNVVADTEEAITHTLGRIPKGFVVIDRDKASSLYDGGTAWTSTIIYLKSDTASTTYTIFIF